MLPVSMEIPNASSIKAFCATDIRGDWVMGANAEAEATRVVKITAVFIICFENYNNRSFEAYAKVAR